MTHFFDMKVKKKEKNHGFTLIELLVAVGMFALLMTMIVSALLTMIYTNRKGQALSLVTTNLDFALESMTRYVRIGYDYNCVGASAPNCASPGSNEFSFTSPIDVDGDLSSPDSVRFRFENNAIVRQVNGGTWIPLTGSDIVVDTTVSRFYVTGATRPDAFQPKVVIVLKATANVLGQTTTFNLQTTATQRIPDN